MPYILMATYTGTRSHRMFTASFVREPGRPWIDLKRGVYHRAAPKEDVATNKTAPTCRIPKKLLRHMRRWYKLGRRYPIEYNGKPAKDSPRYEAIGNAIAVPVLAWLGQRLEIVHGL